ncbi:MAG: PBP1A family penicillin-binding protein [Candidatus Taylorbacteria bacterium]|nr:PBP1A family penicillin-binding protein [Candidatus Taylorbacteria bacterium]
MHRHHRHRRHLIRSVVLLSLSGGLFALGLLTLWVSSWKLPDLSDFSDRKVSESTKIYDRTGTTVLYDLHKGAQRTVVPYSEISRNVKNATVAIEDNEFWQHNGIRIKAIFRAIFANLSEGNLLGGQGGSTITQQVVKNSLLTNEKKLSRKLKEWVLALRLEKAFDKETILSLYLNEIPYGGTLYGIEEASQAFLGKSSRDLSIAEAAYMAALPNAPTYYSPYGNHKDKLAERKNLVLRRMQEVGFITEAEYAHAKKEVVAFKPNSETGILAPHFVIYIRQYLEEKYGREALEEQGFKVITTLDYDLQAIAESVVKKYAFLNKEKFDAENAALSAVDPKTGQILAMVGSRDYFDKEIDGNFNATIAYRQPGSAFKPFVYAAALEKGYTPETVVFDLPTEFSTECNPDGTPIVPENVKKCYKPENYDGKYRGPISLRDALAQSVNVPAIKVLYLAGLKESLRLAKDMGLTTLADTNRYGLTLVLGGGEVKLLELTSAYSVFAMEGIRREPKGILRIETKDGSVIEEWKDIPEQVLSAETSRKISDMLSDNKARTPAFSATSPLYFPGRDVAAKTGTTNDFRDAWIVGYAPNLAVGAWAGNNDNRQMHKVAAYIVAPMWNEFMNEALKRIPQESFQKPAETDTSSLPPVLRGIWQGNRTYFVDKLSGKRATEFTPPSSLEERAVREVHSVLYWIDKNNPTVPRTTPPQSDPQFERWEYAVRKWVGEQGLADETATSIPTQTDDIHSPAFAPHITIQNPIEGSVLSKKDSVTLQATVEARFPISQVHFFVNNLFVGSSTKAPWQLSFTPADIENTLASDNNLTVVAYDVFQNRGEATVSFTVVE